MRIVFPGAALLTAAVLFFAAPALALHTAPEMYSQARRLSGQGLHGEAVELLGKLHREFPDDPVTNSALFEIGRIQESFLGDYQAARQAYALLIERSPTHGMPVGPGSGWRVWRLGGREATNP